MDILPTLLYLIGNDDYLKRGLGVDVFDSEVQKKCPILEYKHINCHIN